MPANTKATATTLKAMGTESVPNAEEARPSLDRVCAPFLANTQNKSATQRKTCRPMAIALCGFGQLVYCIGASEPTDVWSNQRAVQGKRVHSAKPLVNVETSRAETMPAMTAALSRRRITAAQMTPVQIPQSSQKWALIDT